MGPQNVKPFTLGNNAGLASAALNPPVRNPSAASFDIPFAVTMDKRGNLYIGENGHDIRKIDPTGKVTLFAGTDVAGFLDGPRALARFNSIYGIAADTSGNLFVTDGNLLVREIDTNGVVTTVAGNGLAGSTDGIKPNASFGKPAGITVDTLGNIYVTDEVNNNIRKITPTGLVSTIAGGGLAGFAEGKGIAPLFNAPTGICVDTAGNLFVTDSKNFRIRKIAPDGTVSTFAGNGLSTSVDGKGINASFTSPTAIYRDKAGNLFVADNNKLRRIDTAGTVTTIAGSGKYGAKDGSGQDATFGRITGLTRDNEGEIFVADPDNQKIREICPTSLVTTLAGTGNFGIQNGDVGTLQNSDCIAGTVVNKYDTCHLYNIVIPNTFTPNGDGINDVWNIKGIAAYPDCEVTIFDRYGQVVFKSRGYTNSWDGTYNGKPVPKGVYYYLISKLCKFLSGYVAVLR